MSALSSHFTTLPSALLRLKKCLFPLIFGRYPNTFSEERTTPYLIDFTSMKLLGKEYTGEISTIYLAILSFCSSTKISLSNLYVLVPEILTFYFH